MEENEWWREKLCHSVIINEALFGQERDRWDSLVSHVNIQLKLDFDRPFFLCMTGLEKRFSVARLSMTREDFLHIAWSLEQRLSKRLETVEVNWEGEVVRYDQSKQLCCLFPLLPNSKHKPHQIAEKVHCEMMASLGSVPQYSHSDLPNVTALVEYVACYKDLADAFETAKRLNRCGFFLMESRVFTQGDLEELRRPYTMPELMAHLDLLDWAVNRGDGVTAEKTVREIFLTHLRWSFDFDLVKDVLSELRKKMLRYSIAFQLGLDAQVDTLFVKRYATIAELCATVLALLHVCADATASRGYGVSPIVVRALYYMRNNFSRDIGLEAVSEHIGVSSGYLSRLFNSEMGESLPSHLTGIRMERAVTLIESSDLGVGEVGRAVGVLNPQYFGVLFKKRLGLTPQEYRKNYRAKWSAEGE